jgi:GMP synthase-like glutamine amidotransferase
MGPLRIAILENDTPLQGTIEEYGSYGGVFTSLFKSAAASYNPPIPESDLQITFYDVVKGEYPPSLDDVDGILLTGSRHTSFENDEWIVKLVDYVKEVLNQDRVKLIGVCFGHQIIGRALGAPVGRSSIGWEISVTDVNLTPEGKRLFDGKDKLQIFQMHTDLVQEYPEGVQPLGYTATCSTQGMYKPGKFITVQGHPEFTKGIVKELLIARHEKGIFDDDMFADGMERVDNEHDGVLVARGFLKFLRDE